MVNRTKKYIKGLWSSLTFKEKTMSSEDILQKAAREKLIENPESRCPCVLLVDTSGSMRGDPIDQLNMGINTFLEDVKKDSLASLRVEMSIVSFNSGVKVIHDFDTIDQYEAPVLKCRGLTFMGTAIQKAIEIIGDRKSLFRQQGITFFRPWIFMITDGAPQGEPADEIDKAAQMIKEGEEKKQFTFFAVGVEGADMEKLKQISVNDPLKLEGLNFQEMFLWLSSSLKQVSQSKPGEEITLASPLGWGKQTV
jgi:uncharacterized protein YegL